jgi:DNA polymerase phi
MSTNSIENNTKSSKLSTVASFIQNLTKEDPQARENSIVTLLSNLVKFQNEFQEALGTEEFEKNLGEVKEFEQLGLILHSDVIYTLKRLITGLNSSRDDARQGFALTLTELIRIFNFIPFAPLFNGISKFSKISSSMKSEETRNNLFGRLFSLMSLNQSDYLKQSHITLQNWELVLSTLLDLTNQKIFMSDSVYSLFYKLVETLKDLSFGEDALFSLWKLNLETGLEYPDELGLALSIYNAIPSRIGAIKEDVPIIRLDQWPQLANVLAKQKPFQKSGLHHCWKIILDSFFVETPLSKYFKSQFSQFWNVVVDEYLFVSSLNERRFIGFQALNYIITKLSKDQLNIVFTDNTLKKVIHHLNRSDDDLHKMASITAEKIAQAVQEDQSSSISLLVRLHSLGGVKSASGPKEKISQSAISKITDPLMSNLNEEGVLNYINYLNSIFIGKETVPGRDTSSGRDWSVNQLFLIQKWAKLLHSEKIYDQILEFFLIHTFFTIKKENAKSNLIPLKSIPTPEPSESVRKLCKDKLLATLKDSIKLAPLTTDKSSTSSKRKGTRVDGKLWVQHAVELLDKLKKDKNIELVEEIDQEVEEIIKSTLSKVKDIEKKKNKLKDPNHKDYHPLQAFLTLFLHQIILLHIQPEESLNSIKDIEICYTKLIAPVKITRSKAKKLKETEEETEEEELEPIDVLVDLLISFLSQPSTLLRELATVTFTELTDLITKSSLELLLEVIY